MIDQESSHWMEALEAAEPTIRNHQMVRSAGVAVVLHPVDHCQLIERVAVYNGHRVAANATSEYKILIPVDHHLKVIEVIILIPFDHRLVPRQALELKECQTEAIEAVENDELISSFLATYASETMVYYHRFTHFANKLDIDAMATVEKHQRHGHHRVAIAVLLVWMRCPSTIRPP